jgi:hypothetical protein
MPTPNILTFEEFLKNTIKDFNNKQNINPESSSESNLE